MKQEARTELERMGVNLSDNNSVIAAIRGKTGVIGKILPFAGRILGNSKLSKAVQDATGFSVDELMEAYNGISGRGTQTSAASESQVYSKYAHLHRK